MKYSVETRNIGNIGRWISVNSRYSTADVTLHWNYLVVCGGTVHSEEFLNKFFREGLWEDPFPSHILQ